MLESLTVAVMWFENKLIDEKCDLMIPSWGHIKDGGVIEFVVKKLMEFI